MVLLGIDPGLAASGYGVVERTGPRYRCLGFGCLRTAAGQPLAERLEAIHRAVAELIRVHRPAVMVIERLYQLRGGETGLRVGGAIGVILLAAGEAGLAVREYTPTHVKTTLTGNGQATKEQVQFMVQRLLGLPSPPKPDHAADALAMCICHCHSGLSRAASAASTSSGGERVAAALAADEARRAEHRRRLEARA